MLSCSCWGLVTAVGRCFTGSLSLSALPEGQAEELASCSGRSHCAVPKGPQKPQGLQPETWGRMEPVVPRGPLCGPPSQPPHDCTLGGAALCLTCGLALPGPVQTKGKVGAEQDTQE